MEETADTATAAPQYLEDFQGQPRLTLQVALEVLAALREGRMPGHGILWGPPGTGKTTLVQIIHRELDRKWPPVRLWRFSGPEFSTVAETRDILWRIARTNDPAVILLDEIDGMARSAAYVWFGPLTHGCFTDAGREIHLPPFSLYGTSNLPSGVPKALKSRLALRLAFQFYEVEALAQIALAAGNRLSLDLSDEAARYLAENAGGEPRRILQLLQTARNLSENGISIETAREAQRLLDLFPGGLTRTQLQMMVYLAQSPKQTAGLATIAAGLGTDASDLRIEEEQFLLRSRFVAVTGSGRRLTDAGFRYLENLQASLA